MLICKVCGKQYEACQTPNPGIFRWRDVGCSIECAEKYIHDVMAARGELQDEPETQEKSGTKAVDANAEKPSAPTRKKTKAPEKA